LGPDGFALPVGLLSNELTAETFLGLRLCPESSNLQDEELRASRISRPCAASLSMHFPDMMLP
jgi:hypothetical protein